MFSRVLAAARAAATRLLPAATVRKLDGARHHWAEAILQTSLRTASGRDFACRHSARFRRAAEIVEKGKVNERISFPEYLVLERLTLERYRSAWIREADSFHTRPRVSIIVPVYNTPPRLLRHCVASVRRQLYPDWELCLVDDASSSRATRRHLARCARGDARIRIERREVNGGIARATNDGIAMARGDFIAFLDHDDELAEDALFHVIRKINADVFIEFLGRLVESAGHPVYLVVDGHPTHKAAKTRKVVESTKGRLKLFFLPGYSPDLNPDELVWDNLKSQGTGKRAITGPDQLKKLVLGHLRAMQKDADLVRSFYRTPSTEYAA